MSPPQASRGCLGASSRRRRSALTTRRSTRRRAPLLHTHIHMHACMHARTYARASREGCGLQGRPRPLQMGVGCTLWVCSCAPGPAVKTRGPYRTRLPHPPSAGSVHRRAARRARLRGRRVGRAGAGRLPLLCVPRFLRAGEELFQCWFGFSSSRQAAGIAVCVSVRGGGAGWAWLRPLSRLGVGPLRVRPGFVLASLGFVTALAGAGRLSLLGVPRFLRACEPPVVWLNLSAAVVIPQVVPSGWVWSLVSCRAPCLAWAGLGGD